MSQIWVQSNSTADICLADILAMSFMGHLLPRQVPSECADATMRRLNG